MNSRKLFALFLVLALTGSALALQQQKIYKNEPECPDEPCAPGVVAVQQHSVFVEIIVEQNESKEQVHKFAAVVGLVKKCREVRNVFDNAVLWFNDQFLFGQKRVENENQTEFSDNRSMGFNPNRTHDLSDPNGEGFVNDVNRQERWEGCFIPRGFIHAIGKDDPYGLHQPGVNSNTTVTGHRQDSAGDSPQNVHFQENNIDYVKSLMDLDQTCQGCIFEYVGTFYITDPNDHQWMVDKFLYPVQVYNTTTSPQDLLQSLPGNQDPDGCDHDENHCDRSEDNGDDGDDSDDDTNQDNHCFDDASGECNADQSDHDPNEDPLTTYEPLYSVHNQIDPTTGQGFADEALWAYRDGTTRQGMPHPDPGDPNWDDCKTMTDGTQCAVEYSFMIAVDFAAFDDGSGIDQGAGNNSVSTTDDEYVADAKQHGEGGAHDSDQAWQGNSHPHNPEDQLNADCEPESGAADSDPTDGGPDGTPDSSQGCNPQHTHDAVQLDLFFTPDDVAPYFLLEHPYWDENGTPPLVDNECQEAINGPSDQQREAVAVRSPIVCDVDADDGFHLHDGSQTPTSS